MVPVWVVWAVLAELGAMVLRAFCGRHGKFLGLSSVRQERLCQWGKKEKTNCRSMTFQRDAVTCLVGLRVSIDLV